MLITALLYKTHEAMEAIRDISLNDKGEICFRFSSHQDVDEAKALFHFEVEYKQLNDKYYILYHPNDNVVEPEKKKQTEIHKQLIRQGRDANKQLSAAIETIDKSYNDLLPISELHRMYRAFVADKESYTVVFHQSLYHRIIDSLLKAFDKRELNKETVLQIESAKSALSKEEKWTIV